MAEPVAQATLTAEWPTTKLRRTAHPSGTGYSVLHKRAAGHLIAGEADSCGFADGAEERILVQLSETVMRLSAGQQDGSIDVQKGRITDQFACCF